MKIAVDFDGTCVTHEFPDVGRDIGAAPALKRLVAAGHKLILNTMRSGKYLQDAVNWFQQNNIPLYGINEDPGQKEWTQSPKVYANLYIDDAAMGCPLRAFVFDASMYFAVDWVEIERLLSLPLVHTSPDPVIGENHGN